MKNEDMQYARITQDTLISEVMNHVAFDGWGPLIFPWDEKSRYSPEMTMYDAPALHFWHTGMSVPTMVSGINRMIDDLNTGARVFYSIYSEEEKAADPSKKTTGLFFFRGKPGAPFAVLCPGGGFRYVGSLHEGFPLAMEINKSGYNAFVLKYRVGQGETVASRDLIAAVRFIENYVKELNVAPDDYSLWGGSAGARICSNVSYGEGGIKRPDELLHPAASVIAYTYYEGEPDFTPNDPAAYFITGTEDRIIPWQAVKARAETMKAAGIPVECRILKNLLHGFALGVNTPAEGWMDQAVAFWKKNMKKAH